jgi:hypothetical protein
MPEFSKTAEEWFFCCAEPIMSFLAHTLMEFHLSLSVIA